MDVNQLVMCLMPDGYSMSGRLENGKKIGVAHVAGGDDIFHAADPLKTFGADRINHCFGVKPVTFSTSSYLLG